MATRRRPDEIRGLILAAARELFTAQGYDATTTKAIAAEAGVLESLIFNHFGSKAELFETAIIAPFTELVTTYVDSWAERAAEVSGGERVGAFVTGLFDLARAHRPLLLAAVSPRSGDDQPWADLLDHLARALRDAAGVYDQQMHTDYPGVDPQVLSSIIGAMVFGTAILDDMVFVRGTRRPGRARILSEMNQMIMDGVRHRMHDSGRSGGADG